MMRINGAEKALAEYRKKLIEHKEVGSRLKDSKFHCVYKFAQSFFVL